jgi:hypothetical protein
MAGTGVAITSGDAIPLSDDNGSGVYVKGRNNSIDIRKGLVASLFLADGSGSQPRNGVLMGVGATGALKVNAQGSPNQTVLIGKGAAIVTRAGQGPYLVYMDVDQTVNMPAASGANTRYDIVCLASFDKGPFPADVAHGPQFWIESGTLGGGVPATPTDMIKLAEVFRAVNDNVISTEIVDVRKSTQVSTQAPRQLGPGDLVGDAGFLVGEQRDRNGIIERWNGTIWDQVAAVSVTPRGYVGGVSSIIDTNVTTTEAIINSFTFTAVAGRRYRITADLEYYQKTGTMGTNMFHGIRIITGGTPTASAGTVIGAKYPNCGSNAYFVTYTSTVEAYWVATGSGTFAVSLTAKIDVGTGGVAGGAAAHIRNVTAIDVGV